VARELGDPRAAQAAAGRQQAYRFEQVRLAGAVRAGDDGNTLLRAPGQRGVIAEVGEGEAFQARHVAA
jgi:hypothetical protein